MRFLSHYVSPLGGITLASDGEALTGLWFDGQKHFGAGLSPEAAAAELPVFELTARWLDDYFAGRIPDFIPPLHLRDTAFRVTVWEELLAIPYGQTQSYGALAVRVAERIREGNPGARAVGAALGRNPISLILPCHRVVAADGALMGYAGGLERKTGLLRLERAGLARLRSTER